MCVLIGVGVKLIGGLREVSLTVKRGGPAGLTLYGLRTNDYSRFGAVYGLRTKAEAFESFRTFLSTVGIPDTIRSDQGGEYKSAKWKELCLKHQIACQFSVAYTPQQNGVAERRWRTMMTKVRSLRKDAQLPKSFWFDALAMANYLVNRLPTSAHSSTKSPYELAYGSAPDLDKLKVFGCLCYYVVPPRYRKKLDDKAKKAIFLGYPNGIKGYKIYDPQLDKCFINRDVRFVENSPGGKLLEKGPTNDGGAAVSCIPYHESSIPTNEENQDTECQPGPQATSESSDNISGTTTRYGRPVRQPIQFWRVSDQALMVADVFIQTLISRLFLVQIRRNGLKQWTQRFNPLW